MKIDRQKVYEKYNGHCAYCGEVIEFKNMQVDHFWPKCLSYQEPNFDPDRDENLMPSCRKCNNHKHGMRLETWRREIQRHLDMLQKNTQFQRALRFGLVKMTPKPIVFYYEQFVKSELQGEKCLDKAPLICECGDHIKDGDYHVHKDGKNYCEMCAEIEA